LIPDRDVKPLAVFELDQQAASEPSMLRALRYQSTMGFEHRLPRLAAHTKTCEVDDVDCDQVRITSGAAGFVTRTRELLSAGDTGAPAG
jgi:DNA-binding transcriptional MocR family regulator